MAYNYSPHQLLLGTLLGKSQLRLMDGVYRYDSSVRWRDLAYNSVKNQPLSAFGPTTTNKLQTPGASRSYGTCQLLSAAETDLWPYAALCYNGCLRTPRKRVTPMWLSQLTQEGLTWMVAEAGKVDHRKLQLWIDCEYPSDLERLAGYLRVKWHVDARILWKQSRWMLECSTAGTLTLLVLTRDALPAPRLQNWRPWLDVEYYAKLSQRKHGKERRNANKRVKTSLAKIRREITYRTCLCCGGAFPTAGHGHIKFCGPVCRAESHRISNRKYAKQAYLKQRREKWGY